MFAISFDTSSSTYRPSYSTHSPASPPSSLLSRIRTPRSLPLHSPRNWSGGSSIDMSVQQPFGAGGGVHAGGAPPTEYVSISLDTEMLDEDEVMAMGETSEPVDFTLETPIDAQQPVPDNVVSNKVHLRGLDSMSSDEVKTWIAGHFPEPTVEKLEWIDDTSLNLVYSDEETALAALNALSTDIGRRSRPWELREAKSSDAFPLARLDIRLAFVTDKKEKGARERSRYYLFHPEEDRVEQQEKRKREQEKERRERREYRKRDYDERYRSRSRGEDREWDDRKRSRSRYDEEDGRRREPLELFPSGGAVERRGGRRSRSRSPVELFPAKTKNASVELFPEAAKNDGIELFPDKVKNANVELFPGRDENSGRGREGTPSGHRGDTPPRTLFSIDDPVEMPKRGQSPQRQRRERERPRDTGRSIELFPEKTDRPRSLADRMDNPRGPTRSSKHDDMDMGDSGLSIRGAAGGINIRGAARGGGHSNAGIELLPDKASNSLFNRISEPTGGRRNARRQKAEDMFG
ncbi:hypothetical protein TWF481_008479 [Arthrobotrys musiformis]|uniref:RRM domain-containing protein n=1 Tax=Arthrobotrys musiformis TaxID=47236 RepID=A0AAV9W787_9PEZI